MKVSFTDIPDLVVLEPAVWQDERGFFYESYHQQRFSDAVSRQVLFVQDNHSLSKKGVVRGLHYQVHRPQGKLVRALRGEVFDVAVDIRRSSPTFGKWVGLILSADNKKQMWIPEGFAHGYLALSEIAEVSYKVTDYYTPQYERSLFWNDPALNIEWPAGIPVTLSAKDRAAPRFTASELFD